MFDIFDGFESVLYRIYAWFYVFLHRQKIDAICSTSELLDMADSSSLLADSELVSFDVFDTLVERKVIHPDDLQRYIVDQWEAYLSSKGVSIPGDRLYVIRKTVEQEVREQSLKKGGDGEASLVEIIERILLVVGGDGYRKYTEDLINIEVDIEISSLTLRSGMRELVEKLYSSGKKIYALSDMYLSGQQVSRILGANELGQYFENVFVSSDYDKLKSTGELFLLARKASDSSIDKSKWLHIGDNPLADVKGAIAHDVNVILVARDYVPIRRIGRVNTLAKEYLHRVLHRTPEQVYIFLHIYFPIMTYIEVLARRAMAFNLPVLFVAREGVVLRDLFCEYCRLMGYSVKSDVIFVSRSVFEFDSIRNGSHAYMESLSKIYGSDSCERIYESHLKSLSGYLSNFNLSDWLLADVGWGGTIEKSLNMMSGQSIKSCYFGVDGRYYNPNGEGVILPTGADELVKKVYRSFGVVESFLAPGEMGTTVGYIERQSGFFPVDLEASELTTSGNYLIEEVVESYISLTRSLYLTSSDSIELSRQFMIGMSSNPNSVVVDLVNGFDTGAKSHLVVNSKDPRDIVRSIWIEGSLVLSGLRFALPIVRCLSLFDTKLLRVVVRRIFRK